MPHNRVLRPIGITGMKTCARKSCSPSSHSKSGEQMSRTVPCPERESRIRESLILLQARRKKFHSLSISRTQLPHVGPLQQTSRDILDLLHMLKARRSADVLLRNACTICNMCSNTDQVCKGSKTQCHGVRALATDKASCHDTVTKHA